MNHNAPRGAHRPVDDGLAPTGTECRCALGAMVDGCRSNRASAREFCKQDSFLSKDLSCSLSHICPICTVIMMSDSENEIDFQIV